jgi:tetratricopeptide (TPR) repeat protein
VEFASLLSAMKDTTRRIRLLEGMPKSLMSRSDVVEAMTGAYVDAGRFTDALRVLDSAKITSGEGETGAISVYRRACLGLAERYQKQGRHREAAAEFIRAAQYPANLGVGRSSTESHAREYASAAREYEALGENDSAKALWQRAAGEPLRAPTDPVEPWSENYFWKALALDRSGQQDAAQRLFARLSLLSDDRAMTANEMSPPEGTIRWLLAGLGLKGVGKAKEARMILEKVLDMDPGNKLARSEIDSLLKGSLRQKPGR